LRQTTYGADMSTVDGRNCFEEIAELAKNNDGIFTEEDIRNLNLDKYGAELSDEDISSIMASQPAFQEWVEAINANTLATEIENETILESSLKDKGYDKEVIEATGKVLNQKIDAERSKLDEDDLDTYFEAFEKSMGIDAEWDKSTGEYTYKDAQGND
jgi:hypothetical protein